MNYSDLFRVEERQVKPGVFHKAGNEARAWVLPGIACMGTFTESKHGSGVAQGAEHSQIHLCRCAPGGVAARGGSESVRKELVSGKTEAARRFIGGGSV